MIQHKRYDPAAEARINKRAAALVRSMRCPTCKGEGVVLRLFHTEKVTGTQSVPCPDCKPVRARR